MTIVGERRGPRARARVVPIIAVLALGAAVLLNAGTLQRGHSAAKQAVPAAQPSNARVARVAAIYRYPLGCLGMRILAQRGARVLPPIDRASPCWRYGVYVTAMLRRSRGTWRMALEAISPSCPAVSLPLLVRAQLAVCRRPVGTSP